MAAPGIGVGDILLGCKFVYTTCRKYKDAREEFDEIAGKARSTAVVLRRIDEEAVQNGSLVERAGKDAYGQLEDILKFLRADCVKLEKLVGKYARIHDEGPGRRLLWALKESGNLNDLRRRIGYHEQNLQMWFMTLILGAFRRLEGGQEAIIAAIKNWGKAELEAVRKALDRSNDTVMLARVLREWGVSDDDIRAHIDFAVNFVEADSTKQKKIESVVKEKTRAAQAARSAYTAAGGAFDLDPAGVSGSTSKAQKKDKSSGKGDAKGKGKGKGKGYDEDRTFFEEDPFFDPFEPSPSHDKASKTKGKHDDEKKKKAEMAEKAKYEQLKAAQTKADQQSKYRVVVENDKSYITTSKGKGKLPERLKMYSDESKGKGKERYWEEDDDEKVIVIETPRSSGVKRAGSARRMYPRAGTGLHPTTPRTPGSASSANFPPGVHTTTYTYSPRNPTNVRPRPLSDIVTGAKDKVEPIVYEIRPPSSYGPSLTAPLGSSPAAAAASSSMRPPSVSSHHSRSQSHSQSPAPSVFSFSAPYQRETSRRDSSATSAQRSPWKRDSGMMVPFTVDDDDYDWYPETKVVRDYQDESERIDMSVPEGNSGQRVWRWSDAEGGFTTRPAAMSDSGIGRGRKDDADETLSSSSRLREASTRSYTRVRPGTGGSSASRDGSADRIVITSNGRRGRERRSNSSLGSRRRPGSASGDWEASDGRRVAVLDRIDSIPLDKRDDYK